MTLTSTRTPDRYPTRVLGEPDLIARADPTVWSGPGGPAAGPMTPTELATHDSKGYSIDEAVLSKHEVATYWQELVRLTSDPGLRADERVVVEKQSQEIRSIFEVHHISALIGELIRDPRILDRACQLLGSEVYVHQSRVNFMPGFKGKGFYWHSDFETWHAEDGMPLPRAVSMSLALTDNFAFNGGLMVMPGSHRTFVPCVGETPADHYRESLKEQEIGVPSQQHITTLATTHGIDQFTGAAGSAIWFDANIMHGSANNITPFPRSNIFVVFNSVENSLREPYAAPGPRPPFIASRDFTPLTRSPRV